MLGWLSGQKQQTVNLSGYALRRFESFPQHQGLLIAQDKLAQRFERHTTGARPPEVRHTTGGSDRCVSDVAGESFPQHHLFNSEFRAQNSEIFLSSELIFGY